jgi:hypothetical protein
MLYVCCSVVRCVCSCLRLLLQHQLSVVFQWQCTHAWPATWKCDWQCNSRSHGISTDNQASTITESDPPCTLHRSRNVCACKRNSHCVLPVMSDTESAAYSVCHMQRAVSVVMLLLLQCHVLVGTASSMPPYWHGGSCCAMQACSKVTCTSCTSGSRT